MTCKICEQEGCQPGGNCIFCRKPVPGCVGTDGHGNWACPDCLIAEGHACLKTGGKTVPIEDQADGSVICSVCKEILIPVDKDEVIVRMMFEADAETWSRIITQFGVADGDEGTVDAVMEPFRDLQKALVHVLGLHDEWSKVLGLDTKESAPIYEAACKKLAC